MSGKKDISDSMVLALPLIVSYYFAHLNCLSLHIKYWPPSHLNDISGPFYLVLQVLKYQRFPYKLGSKKFHLALKLTLQ